jgi:hypothetical protein
VLSARCPVAQLASHAPRPGRYSSNGSGSIAKRACRVSSGPASAWADRVSRYALHTLIFRLAERPVVWALGRRSNEVGLTVSTADIVHVQPRGSPEYVMDRHLAACQILGVARSWARGVSIEEGSQ